MMYRKSTQGSSQDRCATARIATHEPAIFAMRCAWSRPSCPLRLSHGSRRTATIAVVEMTTNTLDMTALLAPQWASAAQPYVKTFTIADQYLCEFLLMRSSQSV